MCIFEERPENNVIYYFSTMNVIEELVKKYEGTYSEEYKKESIMPMGKYSFHLQKGIIEIDKTKISINIKAVGGASQTAEPYRFILYLDKDYGKKLEIFPQGNFKRLIEFVANIFSPPSEAINKKYTFKGDSDLISKLKRDKSFCKKIEDEKLYILIWKKKPKHLVLTPAHGIDSIEHFEKMLSLLKLIEGKIKENNT